MRDVISEKSQWARIVESLSNLPVDHLGVLAFVLLADAVLLSVPPSNTVVRVAVGAPLLLFLPGYGVLAALFPGRYRADREFGRRPDRVRGLTFHRRLALAFGVSVALLPFLGLAIQFAGMTPGFQPVLTAVSVLVVGTTLVAGVRRYRLPEGERFELPVRDSARAFRTWLGGSGSLLDASLNVALALATVVALATGGYALAVPTDGETYTTMSLLTEGADGDLVAGDYPTTLAPGESATFVVGIENAEQREVTYTVVAVLQQVDRGGGGTTVTDQEELGRFSETLAAGESLERPLQVAPTLTGEDLRLTYLLYTGDAPADPTVEDAYRHVYVWLDVEEATAES